MLRGFVICPDSDLAERLDRALAEVHAVAVVRDLDRYPTELEFMRYVRANAPQALFLSTESIAKALEIVAVAEREAPGLQIIAINRNCDSQTLLDLMRAGVREFLSAPFEAEALNETIGRVTELAKSRPPVVGATDQLYAFLPSKQGVGTSTVALNTAVALGRQPDSNGLLLDMDLSSGILGFMLKLNNTHSIIEAAENAHHLDETNWPQLVSRNSGLDVMHSGRLNPEFRIESIQLRHMLEFARRHYSFICIDLSGNLEKYSLEVMAEAQRIFVVVTPEIPSLHLAREKLSFLARLDLADKAQVILNRAHKRSLVTPQQIEALLGAPVAFSLNNDYQGVHRALQAGKAVAADSELGKQFTSLANAVQGKKRIEMDTRKRFVEYFSILPARYAAVDKK